jgi:hypothetical protein
MTIQLAPASYRLAAGGLLKSAARPIPHPHDSRLPSAVILKHKEVHLDDGGLRRFGARNHS